MLYHAADPAAAVAELRRVLRDDGDLVVVLNAGDHLAELREATEAAAGADLGWERLTSEDAVPLLAAVLRLGGRAPPPGPPPGHRPVGRRRLRRQQRVPPRRPLDPPLARRRRAVTAWAATEIAAHGHAEIRMHSVALVCRP